MSRKSTTTTITPQHIQGMSSENRETVRMYIMQNLATDPAMCSALTFNEEDGTITVSYWNDNGDPQEKTLPWTTPLPFELSDLVTAETTAESLDPDEASDNPTTELPSQTEEESAAAAAGNGE